MVIAIEKLHGNARSASGSFSSFRVHLLNFKNLEFTNFQTFFTLKKMTCSLGNT